MMLRCSVSDVGLPSVVGISASQTVHEMIAGRLGDDRGSRDRVASCVAIHEGVMDVADFREWEAVDHDAMRVAKRLLSCGGETGWRAAWQWQWRPGC